MPVAVPGTYYLHIDRDAGEQGIKTRDLKDAASTLAKSASTGAAIGTVIPGVGNVLGAGIGAAFGAITRVLGSSKEPARKVLRSIMNEWFNSVRSGSSRKNSGDGLLYVGGAWVPADVASAAKGILKGLAAGMRSGSDDEGDLLGVERTVRVGSTIPGNDRQIIAVFRAKDVTSPSLPTGPTTPITPREPQVEEERIFTTTSAPPAGPTAAAGFAPSTSVAVAAAAIGGIIIMTRAPWKS